MVVTSISPNIVCAGSEFVRVTFRWHSRKVIDKLNGIGFIRQPSATSTYIAYSGSRCSQDTVDKGYTDHTVCRRSGGYTYRITVSVGLISETRIIGLASSDMVVSSKSPGEMVGSCSTMIIPECQDSPI